MKYVKVIHYENSLQQTRTITILGTLKLLNNILTVLTSVPAMQFGM